MNGKCVAVAVWVSLGAATAARAQDEVHVPVSADILPGIGVNGLVSGKVRNNLSFGLLASHAARVDGWALSPGATFVDRMVSGAQVAGAFNLTGRLDGAQIAGAANVAKGYTRGAQVAGAVNVGMGGLRGVQVAGAVNHAAGDVRGWQVAGAVNLASELRGVQTSGGVNLANTLRGLQLSVINVGGDVEGAQVGVVNIARKVTGLQLGVVNVSKEMYGAPIGLVSVAGNGQVHLQAWASDVALTNVSLKYGSRYLYSLVTVGRDTQRPARERRWLLGLGFGGHVPLGRAFVDLDATAYDARTSIISSSSDAVFSQLRVVAGYKLARHLAVFGGVTGNVLVDWGERTWGDVGLLGGAWEHDEGRSRVAVWPGLVAGVQL